MLMDEWTSNVCGGFGLKNGEVMDYGGVTDKPNILAGL
jgi:hypothetical protein